MKYFLKTSFFCAGLYLLLIAASLLFLTPPGYGNSGIIELNSINNSDPVIKSIRGDIRRSIYVIKSGKAPTLLPELKFYRYRVKKDDTFWKILAGTSSDMDTLISVNNLTSSMDISPGREIYIPNMRGIIFTNGNNSPPGAVAGAFRISEKYLLRANNESISGKNHIFIPLAKISSVEKTLFMGTGFISPLREARKTSGFGTRRDPFTRELKFHGGIDLACRPGTKIYAARSGRVSYVGYKGGYGLTVEVSHSHGYYSIYGHLSRILVRRGISVDTGTVLGLSGNTGRSTGPHLHFEVRRNSRPVNPYVLNRQ
jgi:murein DD-endopeptidase MepM/ murein hydrolase activator NlpD